ncbi:MAG: type I methionyl aminopeptidase [Bdellovibrio sp.]|nr:type I methionyl aminopeptidase [Bdellovibrio sp.]
MPQKPLDKEEIAKMRIACRMAADVLSYTGKLIKPGMTTLEIDEIANDRTLTIGGVSACIGYHGYPKSTCISPNQVVCHGLPGDYVIKDGDIVNLDVTVKKDGFFGDTSKTFMIGQVSEDAKDLVAAAHEAMMIGIKAITPNGWTGDIGFETNKFVTRKGYTTIKEIGGHGIGRVFHDEPFVPAYGKKGKGEKLRPWTCFTVEPMVNEGTDEFIERTIHGSSIKYYETADGLLSAQFEHTILLTDTGYEILTLEP